MNNANNFDRDVLKTLKFLGEVLRTEKFILRATIKKRKQFEKQESESREKIRNLMNKMQFELDTNAKIQNPTDKEDLE